MTERVLLTENGVPGPTQEFTPGIRYGRWVFTSAISAAGTHGLVPGIRENPAVPLAGCDKQINEARYILGALEKILEEGGTNLQQAVRIDQFPTSREAIDPYHVVRREVIKSPRPASTSVGVEGLLCSEATIQAEVVAIVPDEGFQKAGVETDAIPAPLGGYAPAIRVGDFVFLAGQMATDFKTGVPEEAEVNPTFWEGNRIDRQTRYTLKNMAKTLEAAGSSLENVVKAQVYLKNIEDLPRFEMVWKEFFPKDPPARTIYPVSSFGVLEGLIEINFVALVNGGKTKKEVINVPSARQPLFHEPHAVRAGEFLFLSGLMAADKDGLVEPARVRPGSPYTVDTAEEQMRDILEQAKIICSAAGADLSSCVRLLTVFTDFSDFPSATRVRSQYFPNGQPATNNILVRGPLHVPGCKLLVDMWVPSGQSA